MPTTKMTEAVRLLDRLETLILHRDVIDREIAQIRRQLAGEASRVVEGTPPPAASTRKKSRRRRRLAAAVEARREAVMAAIEAGARTRKEIALTAGIPVDSAWNDIHRLMVAGRVVAQPTGTNGMPRHYLPVSPRKGES